MKATGVTRPLDRLGRIVIPIEIRRQFNMKDRQPLEIYIEHQNIHLRPVAEDDIHAGMVRVLDQLGRLVLPKELRTMFDIAENDMVQFFTTGSEIVVRKYFANHTCVFCDAIEPVPGNFLEVNGKLVCPEHTAFIVRKAM